MGPQAQAALVAALGSPTAAVRRAAARALGRLGPQARAATKALLTALSDPEAQVRQEAARALARIRPGEGRE